MGAKASTTLPEASREWLKVAFRKPAGLLIAKAIRPTLPLSARMRIVARIAGNNLLARSFLCMELLRDLHESDPTEFHRFLWANHVRGNSYGKTYEILNRYGNENLRPSRRKLFEFLQVWLRDHNIEQTRDVDSVFDVGCSLGYVLRFLETEVFTAATCLRGADVDRYAVETGNAYLRSLGSRIELVTGDVNDLDAAMGQRKYDIVLCCGVLMYVDEETGTRAVKTMLEHTSGLLGMITLAHPLADNVELPHSYARREDLGFVHNVDRMVARAGGRVVSRKWTAPPKAGRCPINLPLFTVARPDDTKWRPQSTLI